MDLRVWVMMAAIQAPEMDAVTCQALHVLEKLFFCPVEWRKGREYRFALYIVKLIMERNLNPVIVFSFCKKDCEKYALELNREDYKDEVEKDLIDLTLLLF